ncbi:hypothetical protein OIA45_48735 (plasmid) [Streptomyces chartreusis]|uniref:hypothetical protein n=1 Tax=Streptomyces chartreusis TaxID=1969 RepID=UPI0037DCFA95|nr:hypothetical protein OIA45_48735 [Streptomyces chartreusis]
MNKTPHNRPRPTHRRTLRRTLTALTLAGLIAAGAALADDILTPNGDTTWGAPAPALKDTTWG